MLGSHRVLATFFEGHVFLIQNVSREAVSASRSRNVIVSSLGVGIPAKCSTCRIVLAAMFERHAEPVAVEAPKINDRLCSLEITSSRTQFNI